MKRFIKHFTQQESRVRLLIRIFSLYLKCVDITTRWQVITEGDMPKNTGFIFTSWHGRILMANVGWRYTGHGDTPLHFIVSPSEDGKILKHFLQSFGFIPLVGSSGSGTGHIPIKNAFKVLKKNMPFAIAPDGSRGPIYKMKQGIGFLAQKQQVPIVLFSFNTSRRRVLNSWDKMIVPKLFSRGVIIIKVINPQDMQDLDKQQLHTYLQQALCDVTHRSDVYFDHA